MLLYQHRKEELWRDHSFWLKAEHFPTFSVTGGNSEPPEATKICLETVLTMRNLAYIAWSFRIWGPAPIRESTSNTMNSFNKSGTFPRMPCFPQTSVSAQASSMEGPELWSLLLLLGPNQLFIYQLAEHRMKLICVLRFLPEGLVIGNMSSLS